MTNLFEHHQLTIETTGDLATDPEQIDSLPTAYAGATLTKTQATGLDDPDPTRYEVDISVPIENTGQVLRTNLASNPSAETNLTGYRLGTGSPGVTLARVVNATYATSGEASVWVTGPTPSTSRTDLVLDDTPIASPPGSWVGFSFDFRSSLSGVPRVRPAIWPYSAGAPGTFIWGTPIAAPPFVFSRLQFVAQLPVGADAWEPWVSFQGETLNSPPPDGWRGIVDSVLCVHGSTREEVEAALAAGYFDGSTTDTQTRWYDFTGADHASPSEEYAPDLAPQVGDDVNVWVSAANYGQQELAPFSGRVESLTRSRRTMRRRDGSEFDVWWYHVAATDKIGVLARTRVGSTPWPEENVQQRWARIRALIPGLTIETESRADQVNVQCAARDVDNVSALELLRDTVAIVDGVILDLGEFGVISSNRDDILSGPDDPFSLLHLPAGGFERGEDVLDYDLAINVARVTGKQLDADGEPIDTTVTYTNTAARSRYGESAYSISGDGMAPTDGTFADTYAAQRAQRLVDEIAEPVWRIDGAVVAVQGALAALKAADDDAESGIYSDALQALIDEPLGRCVQFVGAPPGGRDVFRVIGVRLTYGGARNESLELEVEPWQMVAPLPYVE